VGGYRRVTLAGSAHGHADSRVVIAANNGHNRARSQPSPSNLLAIPIMTLSFEDFPPGHFGTFGPRRVTREEVLAFSAEYDPQPMHHDEEAA
jgi:acyl dehydratase